MKPGPQKAQITQITYRPQKAQISQIELPPGRRNRRSKLCCEVDAALKRQRCRVFHVYDTASHCRPRLRRCVDNQRPHRDHTACVDYTLNSADLLRELSDAIFREDSIRMRTWQDAKWAILRCRIVDMQTQRDDLLDSPRPRNFDTIERVGNLNHSLTRKNAGMHRETVLRVICAFCGPGVLPFFASASSAALALI